MASTDGQSTSILNSDGNTDRKPPESRGDDALGATAGIKPEDLACRIFSTNSNGSPSLQDPRITSRADRTKAEWQVVAAAGLPLIEALTTIEAQGTEHKVRFRGAFVEKHQRMDGWVPIATREGKIGVAHAVPSEYLRRLHLQNDLFGDSIRIIGVTPARRFAIIQPTLKGGEPTEIEIREVLETAGWVRVPIDLQDLPTVLMGSAWWHREEKVILLDARKPNFKKTDYGILPIDLVLADLTPETRELLEQPLR